MLQVCHKLRKLTYLAFYSLFCFLLYACNCGVMESEPDKGPDVIALFANTNGVDSNNVKNLNLAEESVFAFDVILSNIGTDTAEKAVIVYYQSTNSSNFINSNAVLSSNEISNLALPVGGLREIKTNLTSPADPGLYYYSVCAEDIPDEINKKNNCRTIVANVASPNLVAELSVSESALTQGQPFTLQSVISNAGTAQSMVTFLDYYRSTNGVLDTNALRLTSGTGIMINGIAPSAVFNNTYNRSAPQETNSYYYFVCVGVSQTELITNDNCSDAAIVNVNVPDLDVDNLSIIGADGNEYNRLLPMATFVMRADVINIGSASSEDITDLKYFKADDSNNLNPDLDTLIGTKRIRVLEPGDSEIEKASEAMNAPSIEGTYYYYVYVEPVSRESILTNNISEVWTVVVARPDLVVVDADISDESPSFGDSITLSVVVSNQGESIANETALDFFQSSSPGIAGLPGDTSLADGIIVPQLDVGETISITQVIRAPSEAGIYYYGACVDQVSGENGDANNCSDRDNDVEVIVGRPDLVVEPSVSSPLLYMTPITLTVIVTNEGGSIADGTTLTFFRSTDAFNTNQGYSRLGATNVPSLAADAGSEYSITDGSMLIPDMPYFYWGQVEGVNQEAFTDNNRSNVRVVIKSPDLIVATPTSDPNRPLTVTEPFTLTASVSNIGSTSSDSTTLRWYRSVNSIITSNDTPLGTSMVSGVSSSNHESQSITVSAPNNEGDYYYGACVDTLTSEYVKDNNCSSGKLINVRRPNLIISLLSNLTGARSTGQSFRLQLTVSNAGESLSEATTFDIFRDRVEAFVIREFTDLQTGIEMPSILPGEIWNTTDLLVYSETNLFTHAYSYGVRVFGVRGDANNKVERISVQINAPDLVPIVTIDDTNVLPGQSISYRLDIRNNGPGHLIAPVVFKIERSPTKFYDRLIATRTIGPLSPNQQSSLFLTNFIIPGIYNTSDRYYLVAGERAYGEVSTEFLNNTTSNEFSVSTSFSISDLGSYQCRGITYDGDNFYLLGYKRFSGFSLPETGFFRYDGDDGDYEYYSRINLGSVFDPNGLTYGTPINGGENRLWYVVDGPNYTDRVFSSSLSSDGTIVNNFSGSSSSGAGLDGSDRTFRIWSLDQGGVGDHDPLGLAFDGTNFYYLENDISSIGDNDGIIRYSRTYDNSLPNPTWTKTGNIEIAYNSARAIAIHNGQLYVVFDESNNNTTIRGYNIITNPFSISGNGFSSTYSFSSDNVPVGITVNTINGWTAAWIVDEGQNRVYRVHISGP